MPYKIDLNSLSGAVQNALKGAIAAIVKEETEKANAIVAQRIAQAAVELNVQVSKMNRMDRDTTELTIIVTGKE